MNIALELVTNTLPATVIFPADLSPSRESGKVHSDGNQEMYRLLRSFKRRLFAWR